VDKNLLDEFLLWDIIMEKLYLKNSTNMNEFQQYIEEAFCDLEEDTELCKRILQTVLKKDSDCV
jgi:hypothetical protein